VRDIKSRTEVEEAEVVLLRFIFIFVFVNCESECHSMFSSHFKWWWGTSRRTRLQKKDKNNKFAMVLRGVTSKGFQKDRVN